MIPEKGKIETVMENYYHALALLIQKDIEQAYYFVKKDILDMMGKITIFQVAMIAGSSILIISWLNRSKLYRSIGRALQSKDRFINQRIKVWEANYALNTTDQNKELLRILIQEISTDPVPSSKCLSTIYQFIDQHKDIFRSHMTFSDLCTYLSTLDDYSECKWELAGIFVDTLPFNNGNLGSSDVVSTAWRNVYNQKLLQFPQNGPDAVLRNIAKVFACLVTILDIKKYPRQPLPPGLDIQLKNALQSNMSDYYNITYRMSVR